MQNTVLGPGIAPGTPFCVNMTEDQIHSAAKALQKIRPAYGPIIEFYSRVFRAQTAAMADINLSPISIEKQILDQKALNEMPLITPAQFRIDTRSAKRLLNEICSLASAYAPKLAKDADTLIAAVKDKKIEPGRLFADILDGMDIAECAHPLGMKAETLAFFAFSAMAPSIQLCAAQLAHYLKAMPARSGAARSYCPVCGSSPNLALFDESGRKHVSCSLCGHIWQVRRMGCLFCDAISKDSHHYFFTGEETEYRVYCCDECHHYIKTVDIREMGRGFFPKLELIATLHLDMKARDQGYHAPGKNMHMM